MSTQTSLGGTPVDDCRLLITLPRPDVPIQAGRAVEVSFVLKNEGTTPLLVPHRWAWTDYKLVLVNEDGRPTPLTRFGTHAAEREDAAAAMAVIAPGDQSVSRLLVNRLYDMTMTGHYTLEASKTLPNRDGSGFITVTSNRIEIIIDD